MDRNGSIRIKTGLYVQIPVPPPKKKKKKELRQGWQSGSSGSTPS
jgi:hypothetical protein